MSKTKACVLIAPWVAVCVALLTHSSIDAIAGTCIVALFASIILAMVLDS